MSLATSASTTTHEQHITPGLSLRFLSRPAECAWLAVALLLIWCGILFFYGLGSGELYRTESLRAILAEEFLRSGNWIVPTLYGQPIFTKPPGMYAAIALVSAPFGAVSEWTARLPSALAATIAVFLVYGYFSRQLGRLGGLVAAAILPASFMWLDKADAAEIDMMQVAWVTGALLCFFRALDVEAGIEDRGLGIEDRGWRIEDRGLKTETMLALAPDRQPSILYPLSSILHPLWFWWIAALVCVAGGVLTKWTAPVFFYGTAVPLLWWRGRLRLLFGRHHLASVLLGAAFCFSWMGAAIALTGWQPFYDTVSREALARLFLGHSGHGYPCREALLHPLRLLAATLPWSALALLALRPGFSQSWDARGRRLLQ